MTECKLVGKRYIVEGGDKRVGQRNWQTTVFSMILVRTGVMEMGHKSACCFGGRDLGMMIACFHCRGIVDVASERLKK